MSHGILQRPYEPDSSTPKGSGLAPFWPRRRWLAGASALVLGTGALGAWWGRRGAARLQPSNPPPSPEVRGTDAPRIQAEVPPIVFGFPTPQERLLDTGDPAVYMPTASGRLESALYGSVRTVQVGRQVVPSFHEGIDIAPTRRGRGGVALDDVWAAADGVVGYINRHAGDSNYGLYVVLVHQDPIGPVYTLYAHLDEIERSLHVGQPVPRGARLGRMGHTPPHIIPVERSHLHFEVGVILNQNFPTWYRRHRFKPDHGLYHGWNLQGLDPLVPYRLQAAGIAFRLQDWAEGTPTAIELSVRAPRPNYFAEYAACWHVEPGDPRPWILEISEGGVPLRARTGAAEASEVRGRTPQVVRVDEAVLGRNGRRLVAKANGSYTLGSAGRQWLDILLWPG